MLRPGALPLLLFALHGACGHPSIRRAATTRQLLPERGSPATLLSLRGGSGKPEDQRIQAYEWTVNIATPAALVSGAALASTFEVLPEIMKSLADEAPVDWIQAGNGICALLLTVSFALEIFVVYAATVTGTMLLSARKKQKLEFDYVATSATELLHRDLEFEYVAIRAGFFQGLMNWLLAIACRFFCVSGTAQGRAKHLCAAIGLALTSLNFLMLAFYNHHLNYYSNYAEMLKRLFVLFRERYFRFQDFRIMPWFAVPFAVGSVYFIVLTFM